MSAKPRRKKWSGPDDAHIYVRYDGRYELGLRLTDSTGVRKLRWIGPFDEPEDARAKRDELKVDDRKGVKIAADPRLVFNDVADQWLENYVKVHLKGQTIPTYQSHLAHLRPVFGHRRLKDITKHDVVDYLASAQGASWTLCGRRTVLSGVFEYAEDVLGFSGNPAKGLPRRRSPRGQSEREHRILTPAETERLLAETNPDDRVLLSLVRRTGTRKAEALGLTWHDLDLSAGFISIRKQLDRHGKRTDPKTKNSVRTILVDPDLVRMLVEHKLAARHSTPEDLVFVREGYLPYSHKALDYALEVAAKRAGITGLSPHDLRHTHASELIALGWDSVRVAKRLGDTTETVLRVYAHEFDRARHAERERADLTALFGGNAGSGSVLETGETVAATVTNVVSLTNA